VDRELLAYFARVRREEGAGSGEHRVRESGERVGPVMARIVARLPDCPAVVFSRFGAVLSQTPPAIALFGDYTRPAGSPSRAADQWLTGPAARERCLVEVGGTDRRHVRRYRHAELGELELCRQLLIDPRERQVLLLYTAVPGSPSDGKLRRLGPGRC
jgi:hypothetical protein